MDLPVLPLHKHPEYTMQCCELINEEWRGPIPSRKRMVEYSCDTLPVCLILLKDDKVIGHCRLSPVPDKSDCCFSDLVVISKSLRGKGYGSYLMTKAEEYSKNVLNLKEIYLATTGQELFYSKLGYHVCDPIFTSTPKSTSTDDQNKRPAPSAPNYTTMKKIL